VNIYRILWAPTANHSNAPTHYQNDAPAVLTHRGVTVYRLTTSFDYVLDGACIAQRCGKSPKVIDDILDGRCPVADAVAAHLRERGFTPVTYGQVIG
jgi:hypothetical protein